MDTWVRTLTVAIASLVIGFLMSSLLGNDVAESETAAYSDLISEIASAPPVEPAAQVVVLEPQPVPVLLPSVSYELEPVPVLEELPEEMEEPEVMALAVPSEAVLLPDEFALAAEAGPPELEYVATLHEADLDVEEGFDELAPGTLTRMTWRAGESLYGSAIPTPVLVAEGVEPGQTLCLSAAVHGDELNGIEIVRRVMYSLNPDKLTGRVIGVPIVNLQGFERHSRYLPDRRDLNRFFPGNPRGSSASRIAHSFFKQVVRHCDALVDLHTGSFHRTNLPQLRANLLDESVLEMTQGFGGLVILHSTGGMGTLRVRATATATPCRFAVVRRILRQRGAHHGRPTMRPIDAAGIQLAALQLHRDVLVKRRRQSGHFCDRFHCRLPDRLISTINLELKQLPSWVVSANLSLAIRPTARFCNAFGTGQPTGIVGASRIVGRLGEHRHPAVTAKIRSSIVPSPYPTRETKFCTRLRGKHRPHRQNRTKTSILSCLANA